MKKLLLLLCTLIFAAPAWAGDAAPATGTGVNIVFKGSAKSLSALVADLEKEVVYKEADCSPAKKRGKTAKISCAKADGALLVFLGNNAPANVHWSISSVATKSIPTATNKSVLACPPPIGCAMLRCPPPSGPLICCNQTTLKAC